VNILQNRLNMGFAAANNRGIKESAGRNVLLVNTDVVMLPGAMDSMLSFIDSDSGVGVVGCRVLNPDGSLQLSGKTFPDPAAAFFIGVGLHKIFPDHPIAKRYYLPERSYEVQQEVDHVSGSCMLVSRTAIEQVGLLDEKFFLYCEDVDWCARIKARGFRICYLPDARIVHYKGASSSKESRRMIQEYHRSAWYFYCKHYSATSSPWLTASMFLGINIRRTWLLLLDTLSQKKKVRY
jgi:GT2 family glycosyltransferase